MTDRRTTKSKVLSLVFIERGVYCEESGELSPSTTYEENSGLENPGKLADL